MKRPTHNLRTAQRMIGAAALCKHLACAPTTATTVAALVPGLHYGVDAASGGADPPAANEASSHAAAVAPGGALAAACDACGREHPHPHPVVCLASDGPPPASTWQALATLRRLGWAGVQVAVGEADGLLAQLSRQRGVPVLSSDSDFAV